MASRDRAVKSDGPPPLLLEGAVMARVRGGWVVAQVSIASDAPGVTVVDSAALGRPFELAQATGMFRLILGRVVQTLMARGAP